VVTQVEEHKATAEMSKFFYCVHHWCHDPQSRDVPNDILPESRELNRMPQNNGIISGVIATIV
jgi:hypothetical protein